MEVLIDCYFDRLFSELERSELASRYKRRLLIKFFSDVINSCAEAENLDKSDVCERIVESALRFHNISLAENGSVCLLGKFHNVLYVAAKLCYDWRIDNNAMVSRILNDMYYCEQTFERIFIGAIFGTRVTHFLSGWKSDFEDRDESIDALIYFMNHAIAGRLNYHCVFSSRKCRFIDVPMESYGRNTPLRVAIQHGAPDILLIMLRYGATCDADDFLPTPIESLLRKLTDCEDSDSYPKSEPKYPPHLLLCLRLLLRSIPTIYVRTPSHVAEISGVSNVRVHEQFPSLVARNVIPPERSGICPPELTHLCRCRIRQVLYDNWKLPHGLGELQIPESLKDYLDLLTD